MAWRNCKASETLVAAINAKWPKRSKISDGTIGDAAHASRDSDHNPWIVVGGIGVVRARDITSLGIDAAWLAEELRKAGLRGDPRLAGGGYVIYNRRITSPDFTRWNPYYGSNPHIAHVHVSFSRNQAGFDSVAGWAFLGAKPPVPAPAKPKPAAPKPAGRATIKEGSRGTLVWDLQRKLTKSYPAYNKYTPTGFFGTKTTLGVKEFQRRSGLVADGIVGPATWKALGF